MEPLLLLKPISAFRNENLLYIETFATLAAILFCYYQCRSQSNVSQTDKYRGAIPIIWSITANAHYWHHNDTYNLRLVIISVLITMWGIRMQHYVQRKLYKRGQFQQDSRLTVLYSFIYHPKRPYIWELFVFFGVNVMQIGFWSLMVNMPLFMVYAHPQSTSMLMDFILIVLFLSFFVMETIADQQMLTFRVVKMEKMCSFNSAEAIVGSEAKMVEEKAGVFFGWKYDFLQTGLYKYSCHPNYFGELGLWLCVYLFGVSNEGICWVSVLGLVGYLSLCFKLFKLAKITEGILAYSYASYWRYRAVHSMFVPWWPKDKIDESLASEYDKNLIT